MFTSNWAEKNASDYDELISAIKKGDEKSVESILKKCSMSGWEANPLYVAVTSNNTKIRQMICDHYRKYDRYSVIVLKKIISDWNTFSYKDKQIYGLIIRELIVNNDLISNKSNGPILGQACESGNIEVVKVLIKQGMNLNFQDKTKKLTPLHLAIMKNQTAVIEELLKAGANVNISDKDGNRALHYATELGYVNTVKSLLKHGASPNCKNYTEKYTPLHLATFKNQPAIVDELVKAGADLNTPDNDGNTSLHLAIDSGDLNIVKALLRYDANLDCKNNTMKYTPLHNAVSKSNVSIVEELIKAGADMNLSDKDGKNPLHIAVEFGNLEIVEKLLANGADPDSKMSVTQYTSLFFAVQKGRLDIVELLLKANADVNIVAADGKTPLYLGLEYDWMDIVNLLIGHDANAHVKDNVKKSTLLHTAASFDNKLVTKRLIEMGLDIHARDIDGKTPLHSAARNGSYALKILLTNGAIKYLEDYKGRLAFDEAIDSNNEEAVNILFDITAARKSHKFQEFINDIMKNCNCPSSCGVRSVDVNNVLMILIKFAALDQPICDEFKLKCHKIKGKHLYDECVVEATKLKTLFLNDDEVSLYDYLHMKPRCRLSYVQSLSSMIGTKKMKHYRSLINDFTNEAVEIKLLFDSTRDIFYKLTEVFLPDICMERIMDYVNIQSLKMLSNVSV